MTLHSEHLVFTQSEDGLPLEGVVIRPTGGNEKKIALVWVHGLTGRFAGQTEVIVGRGLAGLGFTFVSGNNRGHDFGAVYWRDGVPRLAGGAWELFEESPHDVAAWVGYAMELGFRRVVLAGHSLGALKVCHYQAQRQDERVVALVAASPPHPASRLKPETLALAEQMVAEGHGRELLPWGSHPTGITMSAEAFAHRAKANLDVYGFHSADPPLARVNVPVLAFFGDREEHIGGQAELDAITRNHERATTRLFVGADHNYRGHEQEVAGAIAEWVDGLEVRG